MFSIYVYANGREQAVLGLSVASMYSCTLRGSSRRHNYVHRHPILVTVVGAFVQCRWRQPQWTGLGLLGKDLSVSSTCAVDIGFLPCAHGAKLSPVARPVWRQSTVCLAPNKVTVRLLNVVR